MLSNALHSPSLVVLYRKQQTLNSPIKWILFMSLAPSYPQMKSEMTGATRQHHLISYYLSTDIFPCCWDKVDESDICAAWGHAEREKGNGVYLTGKDFRSSLFNISSGAVFCLSGIWYLRPCEWMTLAPQYLTRSECYNSRTREDTAHLIILIGSPGSIKGLN